MSVGSASVAPAGAWAVAVLLTVPSTATTVATSVNVTDAPTVMSTAVEIAPLPLVAAQLAPGDGTHVHVAAVSSTTAGSETVAPTASDGPSLVTTIVYVNVSFGCALVCPSALVTTRSTTGVTASLSVAVLLPGVGSVTAASGVTVAVFASVPVALGATVPSSTNVTEPPGASCTAAPAMSPDPDDVTQVPPGAGVQVHDGIVDCCGYEIRDGGGGRRRTGSC